MDQAFTNTEDIHPIVVDARCGSVDLNSQAELGFCKGCPVRARPQKNSKTCPMFHGVNITLKKLTTGLGKSGQFFKWGQKLQPKLFSSGK